MHLIGRFGQKIIEVKGDASSLQALAQTLCDAQTSFEVALDVPLGQSYPYLGNCRTLRVNVAEGKIRIMRGDSVIYISGSLDNLKILAQNIDFASRNSQSKHQHIEFYPSHYFLEPDSTPLIISRN
jgi:hypothetical protein